MFALLENLLTWSRMQRDALEFTPRSLHLRELVDRNINLITQIAEQKTITLESHVEHDMPVYADVNMLNTILRNLLSNAVKFTQNGGTVTVSASLRENITEICVTDSGIGIKEEDWERVFEPFIQLESSAEGAIEGTGLGLALTKKLVEIMGGQIWVNSEYGRGTAFSFTIPLARE